jgi:hypothetical protein
LVPTPVVFRSVTSKPTSHLGTDWNDQWQRVQRWHQQVEAIGARSIQYTDVEHYRAYAGDVIYTFFMHCFHLKDWLVGSRVTTKKAVDAFIDGSVPMRWCRDICHGMKHFKLDKKRPTTTHAVWSTASASISTAEFYAPFTIPGRPLLREPLPQERWYFTDGNQRHDMFDLADDCMGEWRRFLGSLGLT